MKKIKKQKIPFALIDAKFKLTKEEFNKLLIKYNSKLQLEEEK